MTQSSYFLTNGSSLEDCHTNFFALADLCGIKWRAYTCDINYNDINEDPILNSYSKCLLAEHLCVWRRVRTNTQEQTVRTIGDSVYVNYSKELWIFWYGQEPNFAELLSPILKDCDSGSWETPGISYECRTLIFKAVHNLIERCLLSRGYARLGRWFLQVKPCDSRENKPKSDKLNEETQVTLAFNFFLHGDSHVCGNIDVRRHSPVFRLTKDDVHAAQSLQGGIRVILAPYGLQGYLTGFVYKDNDASAHKFLNEWKRIYPINVSPTFANDNDEKDAHFHNKVVEVIVGDNRLKYPCCYVYVTATDKQFTSMQLSMKNGKTGAANLNAMMQNIMKNSDDALESNKLMMTPYYQAPISDTYFLKNITNQTINLSGTTQLNRALFNRSGQPSPFVLSDFAQRDCRCIKCQSWMAKKHKMNNCAGKSKHERISEREKIRFLKQLGFFHDRSRMHISQENDSLLSLSYAVNDSSPTGNEPATSNSQPAHLNQSNVTPLMMNYKSPVSTSTSSILNTPGMETSPMSNFNIDGNEHISPMNQAKEENASINTPTSLINPSPREKPCIEVRSPIVASLGDNVVHNNHSHLTNFMHSKLGPINISQAKPQNEPCFMFKPSETESSAENNLEKKTSKRLYLFENSYDDIDHDLRNGHLYDFSTESDSWSLALPANRKFRNNVDRHDFRMNKQFLEAFFRNEFSHLNWNFTPLDSTDDLDKSSTAAKSNNLSEQLDRDSAFLLDNPICEPPTANNKPTQARMVNGFPNNFQSKTIGREDEYLSSFLEGEMFNSSGDDSVDNFHAPQTPKNGNSNNNNNNTHDADAILNSLTSLGPAELSRMFPTPPSLEAMVSSPMSYITSHDASKTDNDNADKNEQSVNHVQTDAKDWSFVYRQPMQSTFITAPKYAPLENLEFENPLPSSLSYKYTHKRNQTFKQASYHPYCMHQTSNTSLVKGKTMMNAPSPATPAYETITPNKLNQMVRMNRALPLNMPPPMNGMVGARPPVRPMHVAHSQMFHENYAAANYRQNSPMLANMDGAGFAQSASFSLQQASFNSPTAASPMAPNAAMMNNYMVDHYRTGAPHKASPMTGGAPSSLHYPLHHPSALEKSLNSGMASMSSESNSLMLNLLLSDSMFNLFRDHNFESCSICVCNMNIKGNDVGIYLPDVAAAMQASQQNNFEHDVQCTCGFSALTNRHLSQFSGLFYEDETEITNIHYDPALKSSKENDNLESNNLVDKDLRKALSEIDENFINLLITQSTNIFASCSTLSRVMHYGSRNVFRTFDTNETSFKLYERDPQKLIFQDCTRVTLISLSMTRMDQTGPNNLMLVKPATPLLKTCKQVLHEWPFRRATFPTNSHETIYVLRSLQPLMKDSIERKAINDVTYNSVQGPLTWRQFHSLAGRSTEYMCEPQPIPSLLAGNDRDCVIVSPFAFRFWEKLSLEPYAIARDVSYIVIAPNDDYVLGCTKSFFKELSACYETLRLGHHTPLSKIVADAICAIDASGKSQTNIAQVDEWLGQFGDSPLAGLFKAYAHACFGLLSHLSSYDKTLFESDQSCKTSASDASGNPAYHGNGVNNSTGAMNASTNSSSYHNTISSSSTTNSSNTSLSQYNSISQRQPMQSSSYTSNNILNDSNAQLDKRPETASADGHANAVNIALSKISSAITNYDDNDNLHRYPGIVIYMVEPFSCLDEEAGKLGCVALFKIFAYMLTFIAENLRNNVHLKMISVDSIVCADKDVRSVLRHDQFKNLAFSVYSLCKQLLIIRPNIKSLTGLGPAASFETFLKTKESFYNITELYTTPYVLAPLKDKQTEQGEAFGDRKEKTQTMFCAYCLTEDQKWIITSCTNDKGDILQTKMINIHVPNRQRRRSATVRRYGLNKLMKFLQTVMSESVTPWRLVIGRFGRIGHGELKEWTFLLSKKSLLKYSRQLREMCLQCREVPLNDQPAIHSACLISLEADSSLRVFPNHFTPDERFSSSCNTCSLSTPEDATCTHILVFPTPATTQSQHTNFNSDLLGTNLGDDDLFKDLEDSDMPDGFDFGNFWNEETGQDGAQPDSPGNRQGGFGTSSSLKNSNNMDMDDNHLDEPAQLSLQPLALAFYVSTAPTGPLPRWFWANCPQMENTCPSFLKSALLIHTPFVQHNSDDLLHSNNRDFHPLDSSLTTDVLRYALEYYNSLSWLTLDPSTNDRMSCLPVHIQVMMQLYHTLQALT